MFNKMFFLGLLWAIVSASTAVNAKDIPTEVGKLQFSFPVKIIRQAENANSGATFKSYASTRYEVTAGPFAGRRFEVRTNYFSTNKADAASVQAWIRDDLAKVAARETTKLAEPLQLSGMDFTLLDRVLDDKKKSRALVLTGVINGAVLNVAVIKPEQTDMDAVLLAAIKTYQLDFPALLKLKGGFEEKAKRLWKDDHMLTPVGVLSEPSGLTARLIDYHIAYDGNGVATSARARFSLYKVGFWSEQNLSFQTACTNAPPDEFWEDSKLMDIKTDDDSDWTYSDVTGPKPVKLNNLDAQYLSAKQKQKNAYVAYNYSRWVSIGKTERFFFDIIRFNGGQIEKQLVASLSAQPLRCDLDAFIANLNRPETVSPPPAPPQAPAAGKNASGR